MKNQYFGDINDYRKYGLLRCILNKSELRLLVAWMLTPNDERKDGNLISYLNDSKRWGDYDYELFQGLKLKVREENRSVAQIEKSNLLGNSTFFSEEVKDDKDERKKWFDNLLAKAKECDLVFLDPDNGIEVNSKPYGTKDSSKYVYWDELKRLWGEGKSLLIYQHFCRKKRLPFIRDLLDHLKKKTSSNVVLDAFYAKNVVFLLALQKEHKVHHTAIKEAIGEKWEDQIYSIGNCCSCPHPPHAGTLVLPS
jgi:hypothetical protein